MNRTIPAERWTAIVAVAVTSRSDRVIVACRSEAVRRQYEHAIPKLGGNLDNVIFHILAAPPDERT